MVLMIIGVIGLVGGGLLLWGRKSAQEKVAQLKTATPRTVAELQEMANEIAKDLGPGSYNEFVEVRGTIECSNPLVSELSGTECVYYRMSVDRKYEEEYEEYDEQEERTVIRTRRSTENVANNTRSVPFLVRDDTGALEVLPDAADVDAEKVLDTFEPENQLMGGGMALTFGNFSMTMGGGRGWGAGTRTLGYELEEWVLPLGRQVYILGEASDSEGRLAIHKPSDKRKKFIITTRSKQALMQATEKKANLFFYGAIAAFVIGAGLVVGGLVQLVVG